MRCFLILTILLATPLQASGAEPASTETILFIRHGEKGPAGLGQLSCRGLNRALALPAVLAARYKRIDAVFAPNPSYQKPDGALSYDYVRPLAAVEPTAIRFALPVHAAIGYDQIDKLRDALTMPEFHNQTVLVVWEHHALNKLVPEMVAAFGSNKSQIPEWKRADFDSIWRVTIQWTGDKAKASFAVEKQNLDGQSDLCPNAASAPMVPEGASPLGAPTR